MIKPPSFRLNLTSLIDFSMKFVRFIGDQPALKACTGRLSGERLVNLNEFHFVWILGREKAEKRTEEEISVEHNVHPHQRPVQEHHYPQQQQQPQQLLPAVLSSSVSHPHIPEQQPRERVFIRTVPNEDPRRRNRQSFSSSGYIKLKVNKGKRSL